jgi:alkaline phosphatase D
MTITGSWDTRISRRTLLRTGGSAAAGALFLGRSPRPAEAAPILAGNPFGLGVASGDPTPGGIVLWTRLTPELRDGIRLPEDLRLPDWIFNLRYEVSTDERFRRIVRRGTVAAPPREAHSAHAEVAGLRPDTRYWYRFKWGPVVSPVGRTRTAPAAGSMPASPLRFAYVSCQNYAHGYYTAYADLAQQDVDLVVHLGDYIYEGPGTDRAANVRRHAPEAELMSLDDYRTRHAQYRTDEHLQAAHARFPFLMTWDDHEFVNNYADLVVNPGTPIEDAAVRRAAAYLAYWEHAPLARSRKPVDENMNLYRRMHWGRLATFHVIDTRQYRDDQITQCTQADRKPENGFYCPGQVDPSRTILGAEQRDWLLKGLAEAPADGWNVLANQVGFAPQDDLAGTDTRRRFFVDPWDGYVNDRQLILDLVKSTGNLVVITGDKHQNSVRNVPESYLDIGGPAAATEFVGTSISSEGDDRKDITTHGGDPSNPHILFDNWNRGYVRATVEPTRWTTEFRTVSTVTAEQATASTKAVFAVEHGKPGAVVSPV